MKCPRCGIFNESSANSCDCGYAWNETIANSEQKTLSLCNERTWAIAIYAVGVTAVLNLYLAVVAVLVIWVLKRKEMPFVNLAGKSILNFWFTALLFNLSALILSLLGLALLKTTSETNSASLIAFIASILAILNIVYLWGGIILSIIGVVKASENKFFKFPAAIPFLR